jgi:hypothetical protein
MTVVTQGHFLKAKNWLNLSPRHMAVVFAINRFRVVDWMLFAKDARLDSLWPLLFVRVRNAAVCMLFLRHGVEMRLIFNLLGKVINFRKGEFLLGAAG